jgi:hypothetical protein
MSSKIEMSYEKYMVIYRANLSRFNNLMIILDISMFFLSGLVSRRYYYTFYSISTGCAVVLTRAFGHHQGRLHNSKK